MPIAVDVKDLTRAALESSPLVTALSPKRIEWVIANAMTEAAKPALEAGREHLKSRLDRPTPWTLRLRAFPRKVTPQTGLIQTVGAQPPGRPHPLITQQRGGKRLLKSIELRSGSGFINPFQAAGLNRYGNLTRRQLVSLAAAATDRVVGTHRKGRLTAKASGYFSLAPRRARKRLILKRVGKSTVGVAQAVRESPRYRPRIQLSRVIYEAYMEAIVDFLPKMVQDQWERKYRSWRRKRK